MNRFGTRWFRVSIPIVLVAAFHLEGAEPFPLTIRVHPAPETSIGLRWPAAGPGWNYTIQSRASLDRGVWLTRSEVRPWPVTEEMWTDLDLRPGQFYRVLAVPRSERGRWLELIHVTRVTLSEIRVLLSLAEIPVMPVYEVDIYRLRYETVDPWGGQTQASGAVALPVANHQPAPLLSYQHGTLVLTNEAPSSMNEQILPGVGFASLGYAAVLPDLLGFGDSTGLHPYHHARSAATASVDALRAVRAWCAVQGFPLNDQLFLIGYSQGGHTTLALQRELELYHADEWAVTASAPMAGAYDLSGVTTDDLLSGRPMPNPYYLIYLLGAYQVVYQPAGSLGELLAAPYDQTLPPLLNGTHSSATLNAAMPSDARQILKPDLLARLQTDPEDPLRVALRDNDLHRWTPRAPTRLYHCRGDQDVIFANSQVAFTSFQSRHAPRVQLIDPNPLADHGGCVLPAFILAKDWFESMRR